MRIKGYHIKVYYVGLLLLLSLIALPQENSFAQDNSKLEVSEKNDRAKIKTKKIKKVKKRKASGNPNKGFLKVRKLSPFNWDWSKIMWFKAKKSDYKTRKYKPNKNTKYKQYSNPPNYKSETRAGKSDVKMKDPLIPYDSRISEKGPLTVKKTKKQKMNSEKSSPLVEVPYISINRPEETLSRDKSKKVKPKVDGKKLRTRSGNDKRKPYDNDKLEFLSSSDPRDTKMNQDKLLIKSPSKSRKPYDNKKLETATVSNRDRKSFDNDKLLTIKVDKPEPDYDSKKLMTVKRDDHKNDFDEKKLMTVKRSDSKPDYDNKKLMTVEKTEPNRNMFKNEDKLMTVRRKDEPKPYDDKKLYVEVPKVERVSPLGKKLYTIKRKEYPTKTMKDISKDIADYSGDYTLDVKKGKDYHPSSRYLLTDDRASFIQNLNQKFSIFWSRLWNNKDVQPEIVKKKPKKHKRDKDEGKIWDNSVHPDTWRTSGEGAEGTQQKEENN